MEKSCPLCRGEREEVLSIIDKILGSKLAKAHAIRFADTCEAINHVPSSPQEIPVELLD